MPDFRGNPRRRVIAVVVMTATLGYIVLIGLDPGLIRTCPTGWLIWQLCRLVYAASIPLILAGLGVSLALIASIPPRR